MTDTTPDPETTDEASPESQTPTPTPSWDTSEGEVTTPAEAESPEDADPSEVPSTEELEEPSTEKAPGEEPKAPKRDEPEPDHEAVGIGVIDTEEPQAD
ncbi:hypothetical protein [Microbacterium oxydans]|uniref:hypothetical protein n=1 Tax=Microbacterium oxydans TaxID=82380 RepID=UPI0036709114